MTQYVLKKGVFTAFVKAVMKDNDFIGPVKGDETKQETRSFFKKIEDLKELFLDKKSY